MPDFQFRLQFVPISCEISFIEACVEQVVNLCARDIGTRLHSCTPFINPTHFKLMCPCTATLICIRKRPQIAIYSRRLPFLQSGVACSWHYALRTTWSISKGQRRTSLTIKQRYCCMYIVYDFTWHCVWLRLVSPKINNCSLNYVVMFDKAWNGSSSQSVYKPLHCCTASGSWIRMVRCVCGNITLDKSHSAHRNVCARFMHIISACTRLWNEPHGVELFWSAIDCNSDLWETHASLKLNACCMLYLLKVICSSGRVFNRQRFEQIILDRQTDRYVHLYLNI